METGTVFPLAFEALKWNLEWSCSLIIILPAVGIPQHVLDTTRTKMIERRTIGSHFDHNSDDLLFSPPGFCLLDLTEQFALPETSPPMLARILEAIEKKGELCPRELQVTHLDMTLDT